MGNLRLFDFDTYYVTTYFRKTNVLGIEGLVCNLHGIKRSSFPMYKQLNFYYIKFVDDNYAEIYRPDAISRLEASKLDMFVSGREIFQLRKSKNGVLKVRRSEVDITNRYVYKYEFEEYAEYMINHYCREHIIGTNYRTIRHEGISCDFVSLKDCYSEFRKASMKIDDTTRYFLFTTAILDDIGDCDGYKYYALFDRRNDKEPYPTHLAIDKKYAPFAIGTIISPNPIPTDFYGICHLQYDSNFELYKRVCQHHKINSWLVANKAKENDGIYDIVMNAIDKANKKLLAEHIDNDALFAVTVRKMISRGVVGFIGRDMKFVYVDIFGRVYDSNGIVNDRTVVMLFLLEEDGSMQEKIMKEQLSNRRYYAAMKLAKSRFPNV